MIILATLAITTSNAQYKSFAANADNNTSVIYDRLKVVDPVVKVKSRNDKNVTIAWPAYTGDVSQYILERSVDGKRFQEIAEFVTMLNNEQPYFEFTDRFKSSYTGPLFYRVRVEGLDGGIVYTPITILKAVDKLPQNN